jgi:hypothetical protein
MDLASFWLVYRAEKMGVEAPPTPNINLSPPTMAGVEWALNGLLRGVYWPIISL